MQRRKLKLIIISAASLLVELVVPEFIGVAHATPPPQFTQAYVRLDRHKALSETGGTICATPSLADAAVFVDVTFPTQGTGTDFVVSSTAAHWTVTTTNLPAGATAWPGIGTATTVTGKTVRFPSTSLTGATFYCFNFASGTGASDRTLKNGSASEGYGLAASIITDAAGGCTVGTDAEYTPGGSSDAGTLSANFQPVASCTGVPPATSNGDTVKIVERASIAGGTPAGSDYTDVITVVGAGNF
jgi:hypothetical protein